MVILGLHFGHDAGIAVLKNGKAICNLIRERYNRAKHSVVLNTSFNGPGEPIVETPKEAINFLLSTKLDALYLEGKRITKAPY